MTGKLTQILQLIAQSFRLMVGVPEYSTYVKHMESMHPDRPIMSHEAFFRERQEMRYGGNGKVNRCC